MCHTKPKCVVRNVFNFLSCDKRKEKILIHFLHLLKKTAFSIIFLFSKQKCKPKSRKMWANNHRGIITCDKADKYLGTQNWNDKCLF